jgi:hypothetical protein
MKKLIMILSVVGILSLFGCSEDEVAPKDVPSSEFTPGDDDDEDDGSVGGS